MTTSIEEAMKLLRVAAQAGRMSRFPCDALIAAKSAISAINAISLPAPAEVRADAALFQQLVRGEGVQQRTAELFTQGFQTRGGTELGLGQAPGRFEGRRLTTSSRRDDLVSAYGEASEAVRPGVPCAS